MRRGYLGQIYQPTVPMGPVTQLTTETSPSNENQEGKTWSWNPNQNRFDLRFPKITFGPGALDSSTGNIALTNNTWVKVTSGVPADGIGFRAGLVGYLPKGRWICWGQVAIATPTTGITYYARVRQGTTETDPTNQPRIMIGADVTVGGGIGWSPTTANLPFSLPFMATDIQCSTDPNYATEVWVEVYAENAASGAGSALASSGQAANATISLLLFQRQDGLHGSS